MELKSLIKKAYQGFQEKEVVSIKKIGNINLLELYHGPTLAFKDIAMQVIGNMYDHLKVAKEKSVNIALIRIEQLFPLDKQGIKELIKKYKAKEIVWVQEEPQNMGAWTFIMSELRTVNIDVIAREASAATATGSSKTSTAEQNELINKKA